MRNKILKGIVACGLVATVVIGGVFGLHEVEAAASPRIRIDGQFVNIPDNDQQPIIIEGTTVVPLRVTMEALGFEVFFTESDGSILLHSSSQSIMLPTRPIAEHLVKGFPIGERVGTNDYYFTANYLYTSNTRYAAGVIIPLDVPAQIINGRTMIPVRAVAEVTGMTVTWDGDNRIIDIQTGN
ncbi:MAG: copper amine oxidase N-terminal domain-containing protein [Defluviitaleaceae bacterium]|nr:copper amine oxidase N-terminal domain-containing protein [Defluviitaleaceae bacterium]